MNDRIRNVNQEKVNEKMKIGCNLSLQLIELIESHTIKVDYVKAALRDLYESIPPEYKTYGELMLHGLGNGVPQHTGVSFCEEEIDWNQINKQLSFAESPYLAIHCASYWSDWENDDVRYEELKDRMNRFIVTWKQRINTPLLLENVPYTPYYEKNNPGIIKYCVLPELLQSLCQENDIGLCLDLAHAKVTAYGLGMQVREYIEKLPFDRVKEIHAVGVRWVDGNMRDHHIEMIQEDYEILEWVLGKCNIEYLTLEYGGFGEHFSWRSDRDAIQRQMNQIQKLILMQ